MLNKNLTISATKINAFLSNIECSRINKADILKSACIPPYILNSPDNRLSLDEVSRIFSSTIKLTGDEDIGLHQGESLTKGFSNILGYILMNCNDMGDAASKFIKYESIVDESSITELKIEKDMAVLSISSINKELKGNRYLSDFRVSGMLTYIQILSGIRIPLREVCFDYSKPKNISEHKRIFNCPLSFEEPMNALVFDKELLSLPTIEPNKELLVAFEGIAKDVIERMGEKFTYTKKVLNIIFKEINGEIPSIDIVAKQLAMSTRSLQGYLQKEGTSYIKLINEVRKTVAINYLKEINTSISEIAFVLGFSESSAFNRAFKKWTNFTPGKFREEYIRTG